MEAETFEQGQRRQLEDIARRHMGRARASTADADAEDAERYWAEREALAASALVASPESDADSFQWRLATLRLMVSGQAEWDAELRVAWTRARALCSIRSVECDQEETLAIAAGGVTDAMLEAALAEAGRDPRRPLAVEPEDGYAVRLARLRAMSAGALGWDGDAARRYMRAWMVCHFRGVDLYGDDLLQFAALDDPAIAADYEKALQAANPQVDALVAGAREAIHFERAIRELSARALAASAKPAPSVTRLSMFAASAMPAMLPGAQVVAITPADGLLVRQGPVVTAYAGDFA